MVRRMNERESSKRVVERSNVGLDYLWFFSE